MDYHEMSRIEDVNYRKSGLLLAIIVAGIYALLAIRGKHHPAMLITAVAVAICAWCEARPLRMAIVLLIRFGNIMHRVTNPLLFGLIYLIAVVPTALVLRLLGKDLLNLRHDRKCSTYWLARPGGDSWKEAFKNQF